MIEAAGSLLRRLLQGGICIELKVAGSHGRPLFALQSWPVEVEIGSSSEALTRTSGSAKLSEPCLEASARSGTPEAPSPSETAARGG